MRNILIICLMLVITGCIRGPGDIIKRERPQEGPPEYLKGWEDGCESGLGNAYTNTFYKTFYKYKKDKRLINNQTYSIGWNDAFFYCRHYAGQWARWGYFDDYDSLRDPNPGEKSSFVPLGWGGVEFDYTIASVTDLPFDKAVFGPRDAADTIFGWHTPEDRVTGQPIKDNFFFGFTGESAK